LPKFVVENYQKRMKRLFQAILALLLTAVPLLAQNGDDDGQASLRRLPPIPPIRPSLPYIGFPGRISICGTVT